MTVKLHDIVVENQPHGGRFSLAEIPRFGLPPEHRQRNASVDVRTDQIIFLIALKNRNGTYLKGRSIQVGVVTIALALLKARKLSSP
jgi:hypothetical protein